MLGIHSVELWHPATLRCEAGSPDLRKETVCVAKIVSLSPSVLFQSKVWWVCVQKEACVGGGGEGTIKIKDAFRKLDSVGYQQTVWWVIAGVFPTISPGLQAYLKLPTTIKESEGSINQRQEYLVISARNSTNKKPLPLL